MRHLCCQSPFFWRYCCSDGKPRLNPRKQKLSTRWRRRRRLIWQLQSSFSLFPQVRFPPFPDQRELLESGELSSVCFFAALAGPEISLQNTPFGGRETRIKCLSLFSRKKREVFASSCIQWYLFFPFHRGFHQRSHGAERRAHNSVAHHCHHHLSRALRQIPYRRQQRRKVKWK